MAESTLRLEDLTQSNVPHLVERNSLSTSLSRTYLSLTYLTQYLTQSNVTSRCGSVFVSSVQLIKLTVAADTCNATRVSVVRVLQNLAKPTSMYCHRCTVLGERVPCSIATRGILPVNLGIVLGAWLRAAECHLY